MEIKHNLKCVFSSDVPWSQVEVVDWGHQHWQFVPALTALALFPLRSKPGDEARLQAALVSLPR